MSTLRIGDTVRIKHPSELKDPYQRTDLISLLKNCGALDTMLNFTISPYCEISQISEGDDSPVYWCIPITGKQVVTYLFEHEVNKIIPDPIDLII